MFKKYFATCLVFFILINAISATTVKVGYFIGSDSFMSGQSENDPKSGLAYEYLQNIAAYTGWEYSYTYGKFDSLYDALLKGEIDLLVDVTYTPERAKLMKFPDYPMATENYYLYSNSLQGISSEDLSTLNGKSIALATGTYQYDLFKKWLSDNNVKLDISILPYSEVTEEKFNEGLYDLYLSIDLFSDFNWEPISKIGSSEIYAAVNNNRPDILQELNFAQKKLYLSDPLYNEKLREKYFSNSSLSKKLPLDEHYWIYRHQILNVGCLESEPQFYSINPITKEEKGLIPFIMNQIKEIFDLPNHKINYKLYKNMDEVDVALRSGEIDLFFPVVYDLEGAEKRGQLLSKKLLSNSLTLLYSSGDLKLTDLNNNLIVVAVSRGCRVTEYLIRQKIMDGLFFEYYDSHEACLQAVVSKNADIAIFSSIEVENLINKNKKFKKLYTAYFYDNLDYSCIVDKKNPELLSIVNKVISLTSSYEIDREMLNGSLIIENYTVLQLLKKYHPQIIFFIIFIIAIVSGLFFSLGHVQMLINYDVLTHLLNRRTLSKYMKIAMNKAKNQNECFSIMIFDLDNFKQINDNYGHAFGDEVLKMAAETISKGVKRTDYVFRWGGEEFLVLLKAEKNIAYKVAERIRLELEFQELYCGTEKISVTTTVGISSYNENLSEKELFAIADRNLYAGKNSGKNKVVAD